MASITVEQLQTGMRRIPQELRDEIYALTFSYDHSEGPPVVDEHYKPPFQLSIDRHTRAWFVVPYYHGLVSWRVLAGTKPLDMDLVGMSAKYVSRLVAENPLKRWLESLPGEAMFILIRQYKWRLGIRGWREACERNGAVYFSRKEFPNRVYRARYQMSPDMGAGAARVLQVYSIGHTKDKAWPTHVYE